MSKALAAVVASFLMAGTCSHAFAIVVSHSADGVVLDDGFENDAPGDNPALWTTLEDGVEQIEVVNSGMGTPLAPAAGQGSNSLAIRHSEGNPIPGVFYEFPSSYTSGTISAEFGMYVTDLRRSSLYVSFRHDPGNLYFAAEHWIGFGSATYMNLYAGTSLAANQGGVAYYSGTGVDHALTAGGSAFAYQLNAWNNVRLDYDITALAITVTVNGTELDALPVPSSLAQGLVTGIAIQANDYGVVYADSPVPFPSTPGDFNNDGIVDGDDLAIWKTGFSTTIGATPSIGDADGDGNVDGNDFLVWQRNFSFGTVAAGTATVPEPNATLLVICGVLGLVHIVCTNGKSVRRPM